MKQPIFLLGAHKSGTSLLRSLFDGHPDLFVIPKETHLFERSGYWVDYYLRRRQPKEMSKEEIVAAFTTMIDEYNTLADAQSDNVTVQRWDVSIFRDQLAAANFSEPAGLFTAVFQAIHISLYGSPIDANKRIVEKSVEQAEFALELNQLFPDAKFIHIVRNPYANFVSLRRFKSENGYPFLKAIIFALYNSYYHLLRNGRLLQNYTIIRYEDLVTEPNVIMEQLAQFAGIQFQETLLQPTVDGQAWPGNSVYVSQLSGISTASLDKWKEEIHDFESNLLNKALPDYIWQKFGYQRLPTNKSWLKPLPGESVKTYLGNRLLPYFV
ncbi:sulfotransferase family protein [Candidatus Leptofilum sp.]|uniref:sulfotransferase family protein n=1 Tax=Candidatus Leptofilum sp. TaxID=3241576 RepID=UPI003B59C2C7